MAQAASGIRTRIGGLEARRLRAREHRLPTPMLSPASQPESHPTSPPGKLFGRFADPPQAGCPCARFPPRYCHLTVLADDIITDIAPPTLSPRRALQAISFAGKDPWGRLRRGQVAAEWWINSARFRVTVPSLAVTRGPNITLHLAFARGRLCRPATHLCECSVRTPG
jgi:hypothetical protein